MQAVLATGQLAQKFVATEPHRIEKAVRSGNAGCFPPSAIMKE
jgi:hypothetical protein